MDASEHIMMQSKRLLAALAHATDPEARASVLKLALMSFDHDDQNQHDIIARLGGVKVVARCLQQAVWGEQGTDEQADLCRLLSMLFRCSDEAAVVSLYDVAAMLLPLIVSCIEDATTDDSYSPSTRSCGAAKQLVNRICTLRISLQQIKHHDLLLVSIVRNVRNRANREVKSITLKLLACLTVHGESKTVAMLCPGLLDAVIEHAYERSTGGQLCALVLRNLAWDSANKEAMARTPRLLEVLGRLSRSNCMKTQVCALCAVRFLSVEASPRKCIVNNGNLLLTMMDVLKSSKHQETTLQVLNVLSHFKCQPTSKTIGNQDEILVTLADLGSTNPSHSIATAAAHIIKNLSVHVGMSDPCHQELMDSLLKVAGSTRFGALMWAAKGLVQQTLQAGSSFYMVRAPKVMDTILRLCNSKHARVKAVALQAVANLAQECSNARILAANGRILCTLVDNVEGDKDGNNEEARREAVRATLNLASHQSSSGRAAKQMGLMPSLSRYGTSDDDDIDLKRAALHAVVVLAPSK
mmetsp:Transcript_27813/g.64421  ORF Transcript_27813/g.64421 Transcript_27813/m.64421 type:complete len:526 (-) Transcript_27813:1996-3573(-)|eukprot:CAMPEP_0116824392 /NCGR_PEP_ID=MMETSP0418-20121206/1374_1 /TAXON_ID=1158023 /ORGANISM="Astrosyne radiata, Strain 13vi08-1A" /LENGTH=525 /DNA_ID=CAMNT_0004452763 /DNA_START=192 /DNA_END=1769 /DNA_ORIENTATION=-